MASHLLCMMSHSLCVLHHTMTLSMTSNPICLWHIHFIWHHAWCYDHTTIVYLHSHYAWHYTQCIFDITHNVPILWKEVNVCHHSLYMYDTICTTYGITSTLYDITPCYDIHTLYSCHNTQDTCHCIHICWALTYSVYNIAHLQYVFSQTDNMCDIIWILCDITTALYDITRLYLWYHIHTIHDITPSVYDMTYTLLLTSQPPLLWQDNYYVFDIILSVYDISNGEWMTPQLLYLTWYTLYLLNQTQLIDDNTPYVRMKSHPLHAWHHRHFMLHHIHSHWKHNIVCMSWHTLCLWNHMHYIWCHKYCVYDYPSSIPGLKPVKTAISSTLYVITPSRSKISHLLCKASQVANVCHYMHYTWHHIHTLWPQSLEFMTSHALYSLNHTHYIWHLIYSIWYHIHYACYITQWLYLWHQTIYVYNIFIWSGITHSVMNTQPCVPSQPLCLTLHSVYFWHYRQCTNFMKRSECMSSQPLYIWHHMHNIWHHIHSLWHHTTLFMTSSPLYLTSHPLYLTSCPLYLWNHTHSLHDITASLCMISHTVYMWYPIHYIYDIISTIYDNTTLCVVDMTLGICVTSFPLQMISHPLYHTKPQYLWFHMPFRLDIRPTVSDIAPTVSLSSQPLHCYHTHFCMTSYPLYGWHHMHSI